MLVPAAVHELDEAHAALRHPPGQQAVAGKAAIDAVLLDETLVIWGGEFGRTVYSQGALTKDSYGRDHHGRCFTVWLAGGGIQGGLTYGETDDYCYNIIEDPLPIHDFNATLLHCLGIDHQRLTFRFQGRDYRLTDVEGNVAHKLLA